MIINSVYFYITSIAENRISIAENACVPDRNYGVGPVRTANFAIVDVLYALMNNACLNRL